MAEKTESKNVKPSNNLKHIPKDAQVIMSIMKDMDITDYEPRVINQLLEFTYRYITCILDDARIYAKHAKKREIDLEDVRLAIDMILERTFTTPPNRETLLEIAKIKNNTPLPLLKPHAGIRLPPDRFCLSACNYKLKPSTKKVYQTFKVVPTFTTQPIKTAIKPGLAVTTVVKSYSKPQTVTIPKPVIKFSTTAHQKPIGKPKTQVVSQPNANQGNSTSMEVDEQSLKRKREDDDYDNL